MDRATLDALTRDDEIELVTTGRSSGQHHSVKLRFAYDDGAIRIRTGERPPAPDATGIHRRSATDRETDWLRNLEHDPCCRVRIGRAEIEARYEPSAEPAADLRRTVELMRAKYGPEWVADWYVEMGRIPVKLRLLS